jgi:hypothetical protein
MSAAAEPDAETDEAIKQPEQRSGFGRRRLRDAEDWCKARL